MQWMKFTEHNSWEGETWTVYCPITDEAEEQICNDLANVYNDSGVCPGSYKISIVEATQDEIDALDQNARDGYYPSCMWFDISPEIFERMETAIDVLNMEDVTRDAVDDIFYKLKLFFG